MGFYARIPIFFEFKQRKIIVIIFPKPIFSGCFPIFSSHSEMSQIQDFVLEETIKPITFRSGVFRGKYKGEAVVVKSGDSGDMEGELGVFGYTATNPHNCIISPIKILKEGNFLSVFFRDEGFDLLEFVMLNRKRNEKNVPFGGLEPQLAKHLFSQILDGLDHLHKLGFVHADIKPENFFVDSKGNLKIGDFGNALYVTDGIADCSGWGDIINLDQRPPDILLGNRDFGTGADVWGAACVFFFILTGDFLFGGKNEVASFRKIAMELGYPDERECILLPKLGLRKFSAFANKKNKRKQFQNSGLGQKENSLLDKMLRYIDSDRCTAKEAMELL